MKEKVTIYWTRRDLRLHDNPALHSALSYSKKEGVSFLPIFILEDYMCKAEPKEQFGYPSRFFLTKALPLFAENFENFTLIKGKGARTIISLAKHFEITLFVNEDVYKDFYTQIKKIREAGIDIRLYKDAITVPKDKKTGEGNIYSVFTPFKNAVWDDFCKEKVLPIANLKEADNFSKKIDGFVKIIDCKEDEIRKNMSLSRTFTAGGILYNIDELLKEKPELENWYFDEKGALKHFDKFLKEKLDNYKTDRDSLENEGTSMMSLGLTWGLVSARTLRAKIQKHYDGEFLYGSINDRFDGAIHYISELIWREFYKYLLYEYPELMNLEFQKKFRGNIEWVDKNEAKRRFEKWIKGETGYRIVDAAMMQLAKTGYMHNRARMVVASVLTKNLGVDWRWGQEYFRAMLIDIDEASNNGGWQWGASVGADPKPIRIFNPYLQAENYDNNNVYQKKYLSNEYFENPPSLLIEHKDARNEALKRYGLSQD